MITVLNYDIPDSLYLEILDLTRQKMMLQAVKVLHVERQTIRTHDIPNDGFLMGLKECKTIVDFIATDPTVVRY